MDDIEKIRKLFPCLHQKINNKHPLIYFDNAASSQTPYNVINCMENHYKKDRSNIHRGIHTLAERATENFENVRELTKNFINAKSVKEIIFTKGTTEGINLVVCSWGYKNLKKGDEIIISQLEHHANIVPWQIIAQNIGAKIIVLPCNKNGELEISILEKIISKKTKIIAVSAISNALGIINPIQKIIDIVKKYKIATLIDAAQIVPHNHLDVQKLDCDFLVFSAHKMFGPTGVGVLYGKEHLLESMPPYQGGGEMIKNVSFKKTTFNDLPHKFEAGTPNIAGIIGFGESIKFIHDIGYEFIKKQEQKLTDYFDETLKELPNIKIIGNTKNKISIFSFVIDDIHFYDIGQMLDVRGIAVRTGHHCAEPTMDFFNIGGTVRVSLSLYNTLMEIDYFFESLRNIIKKLSGKWH